MRNRGERGGQEWMEVQLFEDTVNGVMPVVIAIDSVVPRPSIVLVRRGTRNLAE